MITKFTSSVEYTVIAKARRISKHRRTSVSASFSNFISSIEEEFQEGDGFPSLTKLVLEMGA